MTFDVILGKLRYQVLTIPASAIQISVGFYHSPKKSGL